MVKVTWNGKNDAKWVKGISLICSFNFRKECTFHLHKETHCGPSVLILGIIFNYFIVPYHKMLLKFSSEHHYEIGRVFLPALFQPNAESPERVAKRNLAGALISWTVHSSGFPVVSTEQPLCGHITWVLEPAPPLTVCFIHSFAW